MILSLGVADDFFSRMRASGHSPVNQVCRNGRYVGRYVVCRTSRSICSGFYVLKRYSNYDLVYSGNNHVYLNGILSENNVIQGDFVRLIDLGHVNRQLSLGAMTVHLCHCDPALALIKSISNYPE